MPEPAVGLTCYTVAENGCWIWHGPYWKGQRPRVKQGHKWAAAHRVVYVAHRGAIPDGLTLDHLCMDKRCVNPAHLEPVTRAENAGRFHRALRSGRVENPYSPTPGYGIFCPNAKLSESDVRMIRQATGTLSRIASLYGVSATTIGRIRKGKRWSHVTGEAA